MNYSVYLKNLYNARFTEKEVQKKNEIWKIFCCHFLSKYIRKTDIVIDLAAGYCEFINNIECGKKIALDINPDTAKYKNPDVLQVINSCTNMVDIKANSIDVVFTSSFFEHLSSRQELFDTLLDVYRVLKPGGKLMIVMPNIKYCYDEYWDFFDHILPISHKALEEGLKAIGYNIEVLLPKFVPFSTKSKFPKSLFLIRWYLKFPLLFKIFGKQLFIVASKSTVKSLC